MIMCPKCGSETNVVDTRSAGTGRNRRRRVCSAPLCDSKFTTVEFIWKGQRGPTPEMVPVAHRKLKAALSELLFALEGDGGAE